MKYNARNEESRGGQLRPPRAFVDLHLLLPELVTVKFLFLMP